MQPLTAARRCDDQRVMAQAMSNKAATLIESDDLAGAEVLLDEAQLLARETGPVYAMVLNHRAVLLMKANRTDEAINLLDQADAATDGNGFNADATIRFTRGRLMMKTGNYPEAMSAFSASPGIGPKEPDFHPGDGRRSFCDGCHSRAIG